MSRTEPLFAPGSPGTRLFSRASWKQFQAFMQCDAARARAREASAVANGPGPEILTSPCIPERGEAGGCEGGGGVHQALWLLPHVDVVQEVVMTPLHQKEASQRSWCVRKPHHTQFNV